MKPDPHDCKHDYETELADEAERLKHEAELCNPVCCDHCLRDRDLEHMIDYINDQVRKENHK